MFFFFPPISPCSPFFFLASGVSKCFLRPMVPCSDIFSHPWLQLNMDTNFKRKTYQTLFSLFPYVRRASSSWLGSKCEHLCSSDQASAPFRTTSLPRPNIAEQDSPRRKRRFTKSTRANKTLGKGGNKERENDGGGRLRGIFANVMPFNLVPRGFCLHVWRSAKMVRASAGHMT